MLDFHLTQLIHQLSKKRGLVVSDLSARLQSVQLSVPYIVLFLGLVRYPSIPFSNSNALSSVSSNVALTKALRRT